MTLQELLHTIIPATIKWAKAQAKHVALVGNPLPSNLRDFAQRVGVREVDRIRGKFVDSLHIPENSLLKEMAISEGLLGPNMAGLKLRHSIFLVNGQN